ncbi:ATP-binding cassette domain-containing protein [Seonamhaeicola sediminis]|uniref:ATP-binding cassette domain-containing protein n=1 Tax=Seonamhaeicola sediminis TaxID=2528206 RepID=A0A562YI74_9FLAO|nr:ABC transporter ATP-binding protein [Seonamhaeicola sediminis]TWO34389.1 ATP-binding cassette domain-containing protein [Seonamhaeicola sediminis]
MNTTILKIDNISKQYRLGLIGTGTLSDDLKRWWFRVLRKPDPFLKVGATNDRSKKGDSDYVWALKNINIDVKQGEVLGIIGKNGAGKSTLLKILSRITMPTTGMVKSKGRIASLLEVGTGFHPELTGKENIYLNGAILGMTKAEIRKKEIDIIEFSGCQNYIDTPVKRYSSGMRVRLAFAVAAFLEPDILVIDEVLAVGDAEFQKKAIGKMQDISKGEGRTVLFVSHNMASVKSLCTRAIVLEHGEMVFDGNTDEAVSFYLKGGADLIHHRQFGNSINKNVFQLHQISVKNINRSIDDVIVEDEAIEIKTVLSFKACNPEDYHITYHLFNEMGEAMFSFSNTEAPLKQGTNDLGCCFPKGFLQSGQYFLSFLFVKDRRKAIHIEKDIISFVVADGKRDIGVYMGKEPGYIRPQFNWYRLHD